MNSTILSYIFIPGTHRQECGQILRFYNHTRIALAETKMTYDYLGQGHKKRYDQKNLLIQRGKKIFTDNFFFFGGGEEQWSHLSPGQTYLSHFNCRDTKGPNVHLGDDLKAYQEVSMTNDLSQQNQHHIKASQQHRKQVLIQEPHH